MTVIVLIPSYCPDEHLIPLEIRLQQMGMNICLVDNASPSEYSGIFRNSEAYADVLHQHSTKGKSDALKFGLQFIHDHYGKECTIVMLDSDGQYKPGDAERCAEEAMLHPGALILGTRDTDNRNTPFRSRFSNQLTASLFYLSTGTSITDTQTGLVAFTGDLLDFMINIEGKRYGYEMNVLLKCCHSDIPIREVEVPANYGTYRKVSYIHILMDSLPIYKQMFHCAAISLFR
ncbi:MAG: glycosyltransferase [Erysipelotrichia bacterium]|nr:glycosyltransferase [Erysipelotrichia bacterium]